MNQVYYVYKIINQINGKIYIGVSKDPNNRLRQHRSAARKGENLPLYNAMRKYGIDQFKMETIYGSLEEDHIFEIEKVLNTLVT